MRPARFVSSLVLVAPLALSGCSSSDTAPVVGTVAMSLSKDKAALGSPIDLTYQFELVEGGRIPAGYRVFVHVLDEDGSRIWDDDHDPPLPTEEWKPGQPVAYTRTVFIPAFPYLGRATVRAGLYNAEDRVRLQGPDAEENASPAREYTVASLTLLPQSENVFVIHGSGWHPVEFDPQFPSREWEWTQRTATLSFLNPQQDVMLYLEYDARPDAFGDQPQQVTVWAGDQVVQTFPADQRVVVLRRIPISAGQLGAGQRSELRLEVDRAFVPARQPGGGGDIRELGIRVYHAHVEVR